MKTEDFQQLADLLTEPLFLLEEDARVVAFNASAARWLGTTRESISDRRLDDWLVPSTDSITSQIANRFQNSAVTSCRLTWRQDDGRLIDCDAEWTVLKPSTNGNSARWLLRCVTGTSPLGEWQSIDRQTDPLPHSSGAGSPCNWRLAHLAAIVESALDAIIGTDPEGLLTSWNHGAELMFGYSAEEMLGTSVTRLIPEHRRDEEQQSLARLNRGEQVKHFETQRRARDGRLIDVSISASPIRDAAGRIIGAARIAREITQRVAREREIARMSRLYAALSQVNQAIVWLPNRDELFQKICRVLIEQGGFRMAWIGWHDPQSQRLLPVADWGDEHGYLHSIVVYADDRPEGQGPSGMAFRSGRPYVCNDMLADPATRAWRAEYERRGFRASAAFPIRIRGNIGGVLSVYAEQTDFFHDKEIALLSEAAMDVSFALDNLEREKAREQAELTLRQERDFSNAVLNSLPGVLYLYDESGNFLRWNKNLEQATGYSADEIATMRPLDLIAEGTKERVAAGIREVFETGATQVEAELRIKDGSARPHYFTGVRTLINERPCLVGVGIDLTERQRAEQTRRESDSRYRTLFDYAPYGIVIVNAESIYIDANPSMCRMLGYTREELVGRHAADIVAPAEVDQVAPALSSITQQSEYHREWRFRRKDGSIFPVEVTATLMPDGNLLGMMRDITEHKEVESKLRESEAHLLNAHRIARLGSWELNIPDSTFHWSDQMFELFGIQKSAFSNSYVDFLQRHHPDDRQALQSALIAAINGEQRLDIEHRIILPDGRERYVHRVADLKLDEEGRPLKLSGTVIDISERKRAEQEREKRHQAEAADRIKSAFLATMSHELRTPLNSIIGFTGIILQGLAGPLNDEQRKQLEMVRGSARHLLALVNDVLDISKIEAGQLDVVREPFDLQSSIGKVHGIIAPLAEKKGLKLNVQVAPGLGEAVSDERRFEQILLNLLSNAVKFTEQGEVTLTAERLQEWTRKGQTVRQPAIRVCVSDTGIGIKAADLEYLFQPFRQINSGLTRTHDGTGLGLAISRRLTDLLGGEISAESVWAQGSTFRVTLPLTGASSP